MKSAKDVVDKDLAFILAQAREELSMLSGKGILLTGGAGFLGYYLVQSLVQWNRLSENADPIRVTVHDNFIRGVPDWLTPFKENREIDLVRHDIVNPLPEDMAPMDYIIHAASIASPTFYRRHPIETMDANVGGLRRLLDYCVDRKKSGSPVRGFLFFSSSEVYGNPSPDHIPTSETYHGDVSFTGPRACYDESKRFGETLSVNFAQQHGIPIKIVRPFNNYGPGLGITDKRVIPDFARDIFSGNDITLLSDGSPTRTFCYVADAVAGYFKVMLKGKRGESYNIGVSSPEISMADLAEKITSFSREFFGYGGKVIHRTSSEADYLTDNPDRRCPDIAKAQKDLGYQPAISLDEGLRRALLWYAENRCKGDCQ